ncbi:MAG: hypothetical protein ACT4QE_07075 [Anaerolineales bacterium]
MTAFLPLNLRIDLGIDAPAEEVDEVTRRLRRDIQELGVEADFVRNGPAPEGTKSAEALALGQLGLSALPEQLTALLSVLDNWATRAPDRMATLSHLPAEQLTVLATLLLSSAQRPPRLARFVYRDGERHLEFDYDPEKTDPQKLLAEIKITVQSSVTITAHGDVTIGGSVTGRDFSATTVAPL